MRKEEPETIAKLKFHQWEEMCTLMRSVEEDLHNIKKVLKLQ